MRVDYQRNRHQFIEKQLERVYVAGKGKLSWNVKGMAAAFVTPDNMSVASLARGLVQRYNDLLAEKFNRSNIGKATVLFNALGAYESAIRRTRRRLLRAFLMTRRFLIPCSIRASCWRCQKGSKLKLVTDDFTYLRFPIRKPQYRYGLSRGERSRQRSHLHDV